MNWDDLKGKTIKSVEPFDNYGCNPDKVRLYFTDGTTVLISSKQNYSPTLDLEEEDLIPFG
jgi:hypothetical protein